jgi:hypothetical protein
MRIITLNIAPVICVSICRSDCALLTWNIGARYAQKKKRPSGASPENQSLLRIQSEVGSGDHRQTNFEPEH